MKLFLNCVVWNLVFHEAFWIGLWILLVTTPEAVFFHFWIWNLFCLKVVFIQLLQHSYKKEITDLVSFYALLLCTHDLATHVIRGSPWLLYV